LQRRAAEIEVESSDTGFSDFGGDWAEDDWGDDPL
jgi:hypothetical protein